MNVRYESAFEKDLKNLNDKRLLKRIKTVIEKLKSADTIEELSNLKKLSGYDSFYRIRVSDYRMGIEASEDEVIFVIDFQINNVTALSVGDILQYYFLPLAL